MAAIRVPVAPEILNWAVTRSSLSSERLYRLFPKWDDWINANIHPTLKQLEAISKATHTPIGFFYLSEPPHLELPIPDFRRMAGDASPVPSADLLDVIHSAQLRQSWYREYARSERLKPFSFIGSMDISIAPLVSASSIRDILGLTDEERGNVGNFTEMLRLLREKIEKLGVLIFVSGIVGSDTHRKLNPAEFRGFAIADEYAPVIFVNGSDTKAAQIFTIVHELAHLWLGSTGLSDVGFEPDAHSTEIWCNKVAAEFLVPLSKLNEQRHTDLDIFDEINMLARFFKVSTLVILRRLLDAGHLDFNRFRTVYNQELERLLRLEIRGSSGGGDYYNTTLVRTGHKFAKAIISSTWEGSTPFTEAMRLLGMKSMDTFRAMSHKLAVYG